MECLNFLYIEIFFNYLEELIVLIKMICTLIAPITLLVIIILISSGKMNRLLISLAGALLVSFSLLYMDNVQSSTVIGFILGYDYSNLQTILFVLGMMIVITICKKTGVFIYLAFRLVQLMKGNSRYILFALCSFTFLISSLSSNILCIFLIIPLTITICRMLDVNPIPYILSEGMVVNLGGLLFVISSIPNLLISHSITWTFPQYFLDVGFFSLILFVITLTFLAVYNKNKLKKPKIERVKVLLGYDAWLFVENKKKFFISLFMLLITIISVIILPLICNISIDLIALSGGVILLILTMRKEFHDLWKELDLELIFYLFCILFISEAIEFSGVLNFVSGGLELVTAGNELTLSLLLLWISGILSSGIHNAPITKIFIPIVMNLSTPGNERVFFSAVSIGTVLGENLSVIGDNLVLILMVRDYGYDLKFSTFMRLGIIITITQLISSTIFLIMKILNYFIIFGILILILIGILVYYHPKILKMLNKYFPKYFKKFK